MILSFGEGLTHSHTMTPFDAPGKQAFWKHCGEKEKLLVNLHHKQQVKG